jgi:spore coat polysaccharide biosynthesis predicted glycosyltransferase SpsG
MTTAAPRILFIPVSSPKGIGEYMRTLIIAEALAELDPALDIQFVLNRHAPAAANCPFPSHLLNQSATKEKAAVNQLLQELKPDLVIFDCSGRASQARAAKKNGAKVVFVSQHKKKRAKGFALRRLSALDAHWITQFKFVDGDLTPLERFKLRLLNKNEPIFTGPVFSAPDNELPAELSHLQGQSYSVWAAGGGGHQVQGRSATEEFYQAALAVATLTQPAILVTGGNFQGMLRSTESVSVIKSLPNQQLMTLLNQASLVVSGGGDMMGQAIVLGKNIVAVPVASDQPDRVLACAAEGLIYPSTLAKADIVAQCQKALKTPLHPAYRFEPGLQLVLKDIFRLLGRSEQYSEGHIA